MWSPYFNSLNKMRIILTTFLLMEFCFCSLASQDSLRLSDIKFYVDGENFLWRSVDAFDDVGYIVVNPNRKFITIKSFSQFTHLESPSKDWGFIIAKNNDFVKLLKKNGEWTIESQNVNRTSELLLFHRMFKELGNENAPDLYEVIRGSKEHIENFKE